MNREGNGQGHTSGNGASDANKVEVVRAPVPNKVQTLDLDVLSELAGCTTEELVEGLHQDRNAVDIAGGVVEHTANPAQTQTPGQHPHARNDSNGSGGSGMTSAGIEFASTIKVAEEQQEDDALRSSFHSNKQDDSMHLVGSVTTTTTNFICKPPKAYRASALVLSTPPTLSNDGEVNHTADSTFDANEYANIHVMTNQKKEHNADQFHGFLVGVGHFVNLDDFFASFIDHEDEDDGSDTYFEEHPLLKEGDEEAAAQLVQETDNTELHPVAFSIPVTTTAEAAIHASAPPTIHEHQSPSIEAQHGAGVVIDSSQEADSGAQLIASNSASQDDLPDPSEAAYLIQVNDGTTEKPKVYLAVPDHDQDSSSYFPSLDNRRDSILNYTLDFALPSDVAQVAVKTVGEEHEVRMVVEHKTPLMGYFLLAMALLSMSSLGAALDMETGAPPLLKLYWRMTSDCVFFLPLALLSVARGGPPKLTRTDYAQFLLASVSYCLFSGAFLISLDYTTIGTAFLFGNCHSLFLVLGKILSGTTVVCLEGSGAFVGLLGAVLCALDAPLPIGDQHLEPTKGNLFALASAIGGCGYLLTAKKLRPKVDLFVFMFSLLAMGSVVVLVLMNVSGIYYTWDRHHSHGIWGWTNVSSDRLPLQLYTTLVCDLIGMTGYVAVMKYFDPLVVSVIMLLEPVVATGIGLVVGVGGIPGFWTLVGGSVVTMGTLMVTAASSNKTESYNIQQALHLLKKKARPNSKKQKLANYGAVDKTV